MQLYLTYNNGHFILSKLIHPVNYILSDHNAKIFKTINKKDILKNSSDIFNIFTEKENFAFSKLDLD